MRKKAVFRLCLDSLLAALYFVLSLYSVKMGNIRITFASFAIILSGLLYSPSDALLVAFVGEMLSQLLQYGFTPTTFLWIIPSLFRAGMVSLFQVIARRKGTYLENHLLAYSLLMLLTFLLTTSINTGLIFLDAYLMNYPVSFTILETIFRFLSSIVTCVVVSILCLFLIKGLSKADIGRIPCRKKEPSQK